jgi:hypothetical protein
MSIWFVIPGVGAFVGIIVYGVHRIMPSEESHGRNDLRGGQDPEEVDVQSKYPDDIQ